MPTLEHLAWFGLHKNPVQQKDSRGGVATTDAALSILWSMLSTLLHERTSGLHYSWLMQRYYGQRKHIGDNGRTTLISRPVSNGGVCDADEQTNAVRDFVLRDFDVKHVHNDDHNSPSQLLIRRQNMNKNIIATMIPMRYEPSKSHNACPPVICLDITAKYCDFDDVYAYHGQWMSS